MNTAPFLNKLCGWFDTTYMVCLWWAFTTEEKP